MAYHMGIATAGKRKPGSRVYFRNTVQRYPLTKGENKKWSNTAYHAKPLT